MLGSPCSPCCEPLPAFCYQSTNTDAIPSQTLSANGLVFSFAASGTLDFRQTFDANGLPTGTEVYLDCRNGEPSFSGQTSTANGFGMGAGMLVVPVGAAVSMTISGTLPALSSYAVLISRSVGIDEASTYQGYGQQCNSSPVVSPLSNYQARVSSPVTWPVGRPNATTPIRWQNSLPAPTLSGGFCEAIKGAISCGRTECRISNPQVSAGLRECSAVEAFSVTSQFTATTRFLAVDLAWHRFDACYSRGFQMAYSVTW